MRLYGLCRPARQTSAVANDSTVYWIALACLPLHAFAWYRARALVRGTSLTSAWLWSAVSLCVWCSVVVCSKNSSGILDHLAYTSLVLILAPFVAVLGARRPGTGAWNWFVVLPMIVVLHWPAVSSVLTGSINDAFELPTPTMLGVGLVMVMGLGNYFGTRFTLPVLLGAIGPVFVMRSLVQSDVGRSPDLNQCLWLASVAMAIAAVIFLLRVARTNQAARSDNRVEQLRRLWFDFQQLFGVVWSKRVMERLNQFAGRERWPFTFTIEGIDISGDPEISDAALARVRWVLRRFVDPDWLNVRIADPQVQVLAPAVALDRPSTGQN